MINYLKQFYGFSKLKKSFWNDFNDLVKQKDSSEERFTLNKREVMPCYWDKTSDTDFDHHYVLHTAWAARKVSEIKPQKHVDISSSLYFCTSVSAFLPVEFYDYRPANVELSNLVMGSADLTDLHFESNSITSLSCMHTIEHIGLGRYGDPIDYDGDIKAINELKRVVSSNGNLLFVVPVGAPKIVFNAHRIYSYEHVIESFDGFELVEFSLITDDNKGGQLISNASPGQVKAQDYGCGCFWFKKK
jgi:hypothetical protein